jgi:hypothetical protein
MVVLILLGFIAKKLEIGRPLDFSKQENHSFQEWLQLTAVKPIIREEEKTKRGLPITDKATNIIVREVEPVEEIESEDEIEAAIINRKQDLIDQFIETNPRMPRASTSTPSPVLEEDLVRRPSNDTTLMTETLAKVYLEQKKYDRAIQAYEILILKNPEKSSLFADRIEDIRQLKNNN